VSVKELKKSAENWVSYSIWAWCTTFSGTRCIWSSQSCWGKAKIWIPLTRCRLVAEHQCNKPVAYL